MLSNTFISYRFIYLVDTLCCHFVLESVILKRQQEFLDDVKRKLEKELEEELGDDYVLDLKKNYDLPDEYKYDVIPEFWEGHNIFDFITPDIFTVCCTYTHIYRF